MEQIKSFVQLLQRQHFWLLCVVAMITGMTGWFLATNGLSEEYDTQIKKIQDTKSKMEQVSRHANHPNDEMHDGMSTLLDRRRDDVRQAWEIRYEQLRDVLVWPKKLDPELLEAVKQLTPIEEVPIDREVLSIKLRESYRDYIQDELPKLAEMIGADWEAKTSGSNPFAGAGTGYDAPSFRKSRGGRMPGMLGGEFEMEEEPLVYWDSTNQQQLSGMHFDWSMQKGKAPSTIQVLYAQEDLWVLQALLNIIRKTNGDIQEHHNAAVKEIERISIGMFAGQRMGQITRLGPNTGMARPMMFASPMLSAEPKGDSDKPQVFIGGPTNSGPDMFGIPGMSGMGGMGAMGGMGGPGGMDGEPMDPAEFRYVNNDHIPMSASNLRASASAENGGVLGVAKRMPVRVKMLVDQRSLYKLLVECANSPLTVEIHQVRFNPDVIESGSGGAAVGGGPQTTRRQAGITGKDTGKKRETFDVTVELYGLIYIYNPVNRQMLGYDDSAEPTADDVDMKPADELLEPADT